MARKEKASALDLRLLSQQLDRIEEIHAEIEMVLREDSLDGLDELIAERRMRLKMILDPNGFFDSAHALMVRQRIEEIQGAYTRLVQLLTQKINYTRNQLRRIHDSKKATAGYTINPAKSNAAQLHTTDLTG